MTIKVSLLDYGAGNIRSLRNAIRSLGYEISDISGPEDLATAALVVFPGVAYLTPSPDLYLERNNSLIFWSRCG
jgi:glutamine amidotransferase/cyclase